MPSRFFLPGPAVEHPGQWAVGGRPQAQAEGQVLPHVHVGIEGVVLKHHGHVPVLGREGVHPAVPDKDFSPGQLFQAGYTAQHRALAAARGPDQDQELPIGDLQAQVIHRRHLAEPLGQIFQPDLGHGTRLLKYHSPLEGESQKPEPNCEGFCGGGFAQGEPTARSCAPSRVRTSQPTSEG